MDQGPCSGHRTTDGFVADGRGGFRRNTINDIPERILCVGTDVCTACRRVVVEDSFGAVRLDERVILRGACSNGFETASIYIH